MFMAAPARIRRQPVESARATREKLRKSLLSWYDRNGRMLPWRVRGGRGDPYRVWLSEIMLQQTVAATVAPYYARFLALWPSVDALAAAPRDEVLAAWAGLGYYARARNLHVAAQILAREGFPETEAGWRALPGVGAYTAAAVTAIAFDQPSSAVDGNVERVMARLYAVGAPLPAAKAELRALAAGLVTADRPGDWAQALMDLGATLCTPRAPKCEACPWISACAAFAQGSPETYPRRAAKAEKPARFGAAFRARRGEQCWMVRRGERGLLAGMAALPSTEWRGKAWTRAQALAGAPFDGSWRRVGQVRHIFTHFTLTLDVYETDAEPEGDGFWGDVVAMPSVFRKAAQLTPAAKRARVKE
jgi:A/G-specific adenine glycosylase